MNEGTDTPHFREGTFVQFVADNVDHNRRTLDVHNTFHGMGMIAAVTPATSRTGRIPFRHIRRYRWWQSIIAVQEVGTV